MKTKSQTELLYDLLKDGRPHRTDQIQNLVYGNAHLGLARVGARIWDIKRKYNIEIDSWHDKQNKTLWWYQIRQENIADFVNEVINKQPEQGVLI